MQVNNNIAEVTTSVDRDFNQDLHLAANAIKRYSRNIAQTLPIKAVEALARAERELAEAKRAVESAKQNSSNVTQNIFMERI